MGVSTQNTTHIQPEGSARHIQSLSSVESSTLMQAVQAWSSGVDARQRGFFLARRVRDSGDKANHDNETGSGLANVSSCWQVSILSAYESGFFDSVPFEDRFVCFADPSNYENAPGWMLRNLLVLAKQRWGLDKIQILRYREAHPNRDRGRSLVMILESQSSGSVGLQNANVNPMPKVTGWERNATGKLTGRLIDLTEYLDPKRYSRTWSLINDIPLN